MSDRKVRLYSTAGKVTNGELEGVTNMEDLRNRLAELKTNTKGMTLMDAKTEQEFSLDSDQALPEGDLQLYILPAKTKSGYGKEISRQLSCSL